MAKAVKEAEEKKKKMRQERDEKSISTKTNKPKPKPKGDDNFTPLWERNACQPRYKPSNRMKKSG